MSPIDIKQPSNFFLMVCELKTPWILVFFSINY